MSEVAGYFITWTTYGTWLPGDRRGWRKRVGGPQIPRPLLESWCKKQLAGDAVLLQPSDRDTIEGACREHCKHRGWALKAVNARSNHVHVVVIADEKPQKVRDQLKANCTRRLRTQSQPLVRAKTWTKGGDCEVLESDDELFDAVVYVLECQDRSEDPVPEARG
jgi:REP element-mobilizing transposase RayT